MNISCLYIIKMIIKVFKISTKEMCTMKNKASLCEFIKEEIGITPDNTLTISELLKFLPRKNYYHVK